MVAQCTFLLEKPEYFGKEEDKRKSSWPKKLFTADKKYLKVLSFKKYLKEMHLALE